MRRPDLLAAAGAPPEPEDQPSARRRRRAVVAVTILAGAALLAATLRVDEGSDRFAVLGLLAATTWLVGALLSGPIPFRPADARPPRGVVVPAVGLGAAAFLVFLMAYGVAQHVPGLSDALDSVLDRADAGSRVVVLGVALLNGAAEELFFRGAVHAAVGARRQVLTTAAIYVAVTLATGNAALVVAAVVMGTLLGVERRATRSVLAPVITHLTWSTLMILLLPR